MADTLRVRINSPEALIWEGDAIWVSSINSQGPFDILPFHTNFISIIENKPIRVNSGGQVKEYTFERSVIYVHSNKVYIYTHI